MRIEKNHNNLPKTMAFMNLLLHEASQDEEKKYHSNSNQGSKREIKLTTTGTHEENGTRFN